MTSFEITFFSSYYFISLPPIHGDMPGDICSSARPTTNRARKRKERIRNWNKSAECTASSHLRSLGDASINFHFIRRRGYEFRGGGGGEDPSLTPFVSVIGSFAKLSSSGHYENELRTPCVLPLLQNHFLIKTATPT